MLTIQNDDINRYLDFLFGNSDPGQALHHLLIATTQDTGSTPLGVVTGKDLHTTVTAIAPTGDIDANAYVTQAMIDAFTEQYEHHREILFAGLALEICWVPHHGDGATENLARRMQADRKLHEHPAMVEVTQLYAATRDGRRWTGLHTLTGPQAGTIEGPRLHVGQLAPQELEINPRIIRAAVRMPCHPFRGT